MKQKQTRLSEIDENLQLEMVEACNGFLELILNSLKTPSQAFPMLTINPGSCLHQTSSQAKADKTLGDGRENLQLEMVEASW